MTHRDDRHLDDGLKARGLAGDSSSGRVLLSGSIKKLDCGQDDWCNRRPRLFIWKRQKADAELEVVFSQSDGGKQVFANVYRVSNSDLSIRSLLSGGLTVEALRVLAEKTLQQVVDQALDDPALRSALRPEPPAPAP